MEIVIVLVFLVIFYKIIYKIVKVTRKVSNIASNKLDIFNDKMELNLAKQRYIRAYNMIENNSQYLSAENIEKLKNFLKNLQR